MFQFQFSESMSSPRIKNISLYQNSDFRYICTVPHPSRRGDAHRHVSLGAGCNGRWLASGDPFTWAKRLTGGRRSRVVLAPRPWRQSPPARAGGVTVTTKAAHRGEHV